MTACQGLTTVLARSLRFGFRNTRVNLAAALGALFDKALDQTWNKQMSS